LVALEDRDADVRKVVLSTLRGNLQRLDEKDFIPLMLSAYAEVRVFASECLLLLEMKVLQKRHMELLIDSDSLVRATTLRALAKRQMPGWMKVHVRSLLDSDYAIQRAAMDGLLNDPKVGAPALLDFVRTHPSEKISSLARTELSRLGLNP